MCVCILYLKAYVCWNCFSISMVWSDEDNLEIVFLYVEYKRSFNATDRQFNEMYPDRSIDHAYTLYLTKKFKETLSLKDKKRSRRPKVDKDTKIDVVAHISADPQQSLAAMSEASAVSQTIHRFSKNTPFSSV